MPTCTIVCVLIVVECVCVFYYLKPKVTESSGKIHIDQKVRVGLQEVHQLLILCLNVRWHGPVIILLVTVRAHLFSAAR